MKTRQLALLALLLAPACALAQTNPAPQPLPYEQDFSGLPHGSDVYPDGWTGWRTGTTSVGTTYNTTAPILDLSLVPNGTAASTETTYAIYNYDGKIGLHLGNTVHSHLVLAISTTGHSGIVVEYDAMTVKNPGGNTKAMALQFRVGTSGSFTTITESEYQNPDLPLETGPVTTPIGVEARRTTLPADCNDQPVVQLRWTKRRVAGGVSGPSFAVDNVRVTYSTVGINTVRHRGSLRWLGQDAGGGHVLDAGGALVLGWEVLDATGRVIGVSGAGHRSAGERVRIEMAGRGTGIYLVRVRTDRGIGVVRLAHSGG